MHALKPKGIIVQFGAKWCIPCGRIRPFVEELAQGMQIPFKYVDTEERFLIANQHSIRSLPTVIVFRDGEEVARITGTDRQKLSKSIHDALSV